MKAGDKFVVIARDVDHPCSFAPRTQAFLDDVIVRLRPIDPTPQCPNIDEIAYDVKRLKVVGAKKAEQSISFAPASAEVDIGDPSGAIALHGTRVMRPKSLIVKVAQG